MSAEAGNPYDLLLYKGAFALVERLGRVVRWDSR
jgi:hypothetical protein